MYLFSKQIRIKFNRGEATTALLCLTTKQGTPRFLENIDIDILRMNKNYYIIYSNPEYKKFEGTYQISSLCCEWKRTNGRYYEMVCIATFMR